MDYRYNERDWLTQINHQNLTTEPPGLPPDKFGQVIGYHNIEHIGAVQGAQPKYNGNVTWQMYNMSGVPFSGTSLVGNSYSYDQADRLRSSSFGYYTTSWQPTTAYDVSDYSYDATGNISAMQRYGFNGALMDNLTYSFYAATNRLSHIDDTVPSGVFMGDIDDQIKNNYSYDQRGNMTFDQQREISISYDYRSLPISITVGPPMTPGGMTTYRYDADGRRTYKSTEYGAAYYYINDVQGRTIAVLKADGSLKMLNLLGLDHIGYIDAYYIPQAAKDEDAPPRSDARFYYLKDHLGNIKLIVDQGGNVAAYDDYDPFGMGLEGRSGNPYGVDARFKFISAENDLEHGMYLLGPRLYDQRIGLFRSPDPMQDIYTEYSPYHYSFNNPMRFVDPTGLQAEDAEEEEEKKKAKTYVLEEIVVVGERTESETKGAQLLVLAGSSLSIPPPYGEIIGGVLVGVAAYHFLQPLLTKPYASEEAKGKPEEQKNEQAKKAREKKTAEEIIQEELKGSVNRVFPGEMKHKTLEEIKELAKQGNKAAQTAKKLLERPEYKK